MREIRSLIFNKRFRSIFFMFLGFFLQFWWLGKIKRFLNKDKKDHKYRSVYTAQAQTFTKNAVKLGGLIIKLGQFVSSRVDILPKEYTDILSELQDSVAPVESEMIVSRLETELSASVDDLFDSFLHTPVAAASLGQVHKATLKNGEAVAVKVMRPGIKDLVSLDLSTFRVLIAFAKRFTKVSKYVDLEGVYHEFEEVITEELDYKKEARHIEIFRENFMDFPGVTVPHVYGEFTRSNVLVMEFIEGVKINELDKLKEMKVNKKRLASVLYMSYLKQFLEDGFFHADPHPGNLLVKKDGTLAYIDFGMVGKVSADMKENMVKLALSIYLKDAGGIVDAFQSLGFLRKGTEKAVLLKNVKGLLSGFDNGSFSINNIQNPEFTEELREFLYEQPFQIPSRTTFLGKAILTVFSICNGLDKDFDLVNLTAPYVKEMIGNENMSSTKETILDQVKSTLLNVIPSIRKVTRLIDQFESGNIKLSPSQSFENKLSSQQNYQTKRMILAVFGTGLLIAGSNLIEINRMTGLILMGIGGVTALLQAVKTSTSRRRMRHPQFFRK
jgi:predicted unusual protein kinase regulating ubiquinone biosynthesis (AarF/ABC1/UbiB family)